MDDHDKQKPPDPPQRPFSLEEAVARAAGDALRGASPVPATRQTLQAARQLLETLLEDPEGSLRSTLAARLADDLPLLARHQDDGAGALTELLDRVLAAESVLATLVRDTDARWGREYDERPRFESADGVSAPDDPYTRDQVRTLLQRLRRSLKR